MAKEKIAFELERPDQNTPVTRTSEINHGDSPLDEAIKSIENKTDGQCKVVHDLEHLLEGNAISEIGKLNNDGDFVSGSSYVSYFYPAKNLARITGDKICYYDKDFSFISAETKQSASSVLTPTIPASAVYVRIVAPWATFLMVYYAEKNAPFENNIALYPVSFSNSPAGIWWYTKSSSETRKTSGVHYGKCFIPCPDGYQTCLYTGGLTETATSTGFTSEDKSVDADTYWRLSLFKVGDGLQEGKMYIPCEQNRAYINSVDTALNNKIEDIYKEEVLYNNTISKASGSTSSAQISHTFTAGTYKMKLSVSTNMDTLKVYLCHDNLNSANRIKTLTAEEFMEVSITSEEAALINVVGFTIASEYAPVNVRLSVVDGELLAQEEFSKALQISLEETDQKVDDVYVKTPIYSGTLPQASGSYSNIARPFTPQAGEYIFKFSASVNMDKMSVALCHDNLNSGNRIISLTTSAYMSTQISAEQAALINKIIVFCKSEYAPTNITLDIIKGELANVLKAESPKKNTRILVGATFFDGWSYRCWLENHYNSNRIYQMSSLYDASAALNTPALAAQYYQDFGKTMELDEDEIVGQDTNGGIDGSGNKLTSWIDYVYATTGKYPPGSVTFSNYFPDVAYALKGETFECADESIATFLPAHDHDYKPITSWTMKSGTTTNGLSVVPLGWRNTDTIDQIEAQIDMASYYGVDYFNFCLTIYTDAVVDVLDEHGNVVGKEIDENILYDGYHNMDVKVRGWAERGNHAIFDFLRAKNGHKMKFCITILANYKNIDDETYNVIMDYVNSKFISDKRYLHFNGRPVLLWFSEEYAGSFERAYHNSQDSILHFVNADKSNSGKFDGYWSYTGEGNISADIASEDENGYKYYTYLPSLNNAISSINSNIQMFIPLNVGWHSAQRSNFVNGIYCDVPTPAGVKSNYYEVVMPTKNEIKQGLKDILAAYRDKGNDCLILVYAWNEFGEGGNLMPSQAEMESFDTDRQGAYKLEAIKEFKELL